MGLENIFHPGTESLRTQQKKGRKFECARDGDFPSSPPPYPSALQSNDPKAVSNEIPVGKSALEVLKEEEDERTTSPADKMDQTGQQDCGDERTSKHQGSHSPARCEDSQLQAAHCHADDGDGESSVQSFQERARDSRAVSGQDDSRNEKFSPVFVSKHNTVDGRIDYAALDLSYRHLRQEIGRLGLQESVRPSTQSSDHDIQYGQSSSRGSSVSPERQSHDWTSQSLPDDLSTSTEVFASKGGFVNMRRGGYSNDGSFLKRNLSPSSNPCLDNSDLSAMPRLRRDSSGSLLPTSSIPIPARAAVRRNASSGSVLPALLQSPATSPNRGALNPKKLESSGSPLKLFGEYDTFTNNRLLRRMGQFQTGSSSLILEEGSRDSGLVRARSGFTSVDPDGPASATGPPKQGARMSSFGEGKFHDYEFKEEVSATSSRSISRNGDKGSEPALFESDSGAKLRVAIRLDQSPDLKRSSQARTRRSHRSSTRKSQTITRTWAAEVGPAHMRSPAKNRKCEEENTDKQVVYDEQTKSKRPPNSPAKDPAPKRRRTYGSTEAGIVSADVHSVEQRSQQMQSIVGRKRKDARYDSNDQEADPKVLALRQMLRPRTPTTTQHRKQPPTPGPAEGRVSGLPNFQGRNSLDQHDTRSNTAAEGLEAQTRALAAELATFAVHAAENMANDSRKPSITTQDFLNKATKVMNIIRSKGKPPSGLGSIEQSEAEETEKAEDNDLTYDEQSTKDEFSRPPSREGGSLRMLRAPKQLDPRVLSHLRKFEEKDEVDEAIVSSLRDLTVDEHQVQNVLTVTRTDVSDAGIESEPSNIRILENVQWQRKRKHLSTSTLEDMTGQPHQEIQSHVSNPSSGPSTGRSIPSGSSRSSGNKALIAPEKVSHLIPAQAAGMTYDHVNQTWVKRKAAEGGSAAGSEKRASEGTEADPFEDIPDLSVDEIEEIKRIQTLEIETKEGVVKLTESIQEVKGNRETKAAEQLEGSAVGSRPCTREGVEEVPTNVSSIASKYSQLESSQPITETRATSWGDEPSTTKLHPEKQQKTVEVQQLLSGYREEEVEHEISILEGRVSKTPPRPDHLKHRARVVTVAFSSPLVNHMQSQEYGESPDHDSKLWPEVDGSIHEQSPLEHSSGLRKPYSSALKRTSAGFARKSTSSSTARKGQPFTARPISRIDEHTEVSFNQCRDVNQRQSLDVTISTPLAISSPAARRSNYSFHLSPLPDFTVHQLDESLQLDINHVAKHGSHRSVKDIESSFSVAVTELVKKITDVEPFEPYWEYIRQLQLRGQGLFTLHLLRDFCGRLEELDVADNELGQLNGAPSTIRHLKIQRNCLTNLTAWAHLSNLQYLDVSGNQIESLEGFSSLIHLRELRADDNRIRDIEGIFELDGLISLRLRGNCVESVDFASAELYVKSSR